MRLLRLHAYAVTPRRTGAAQAAPEGGSIAISKTLRDALSSTLDAARLHERMLVNFEVDAQSRTNASRDLMMQYAFGTPPNAASAALQIATRLADAMDLRSHACLLVCAAYEHGAKRRVTLWTFPKDEAFRLLHRASGPSIDYLEDVFSRTSKLRKAALFEGQQRRTDFLAGRILDFQTQSTSREVADFWIHRFLQCLPAIAADAGTRLLARSIKQAITKCTEVHEQEQVLA